MIEEEVKQPLRFTHYGQLMHLVPDALCTTRGGILKEWLDTRPEPSQEALDAVTIEEADIAMLPTSESLVDAEGLVLQTLIELTPGLRGQLVAKMKQARGK